MKKTSVVSISIQKSGHGFAVVDTNGKRLHNGNLSLARAAKIFKAQAKKVLIQQNKKTVRVSEIRTLLGENFRVTKKAGSFIIKPAQHT